MLPRRDCIRVDRVGTALIAKLFGVESRKQMSSRENDTNYSVIGQSVPRVDGMRKAAGQAIYADDITLPRMLYGNSLGPAGPTREFSALTLPKPRQSLE